MNPGYTEPLRFGVFEFDTVSGDLRKHGLSVKLTPHETVLLSTLLETPMRTHTREDLQKRLWPETAFLDFEHGLNKVVHSLREALGDTGKSVRLIETVAGCGYRFIPVWLQPSAVTPNTSNGGTGYSVAVLPIHVTGTNPVHPFRSNRMTSDLSDALSGIPGLRVLAQCIVKNYYTPDTSPLSVGQSMGARAVLSGELILHEPSLFLRLELIDVSDGAQLSVVCVEKPYVLGQCSESEIGDEIFRQLRPTLLALIQPTVPAVHN